MANPKVSEDAKEHSKQILEEMESRGELPEQQQQQRGNEIKNVGNVIGGHKVCASNTRVSFGSLLTCTQATLKNPNVSEGAKEHSRQVLEDMDS